jgi:hypothetical protein
LTVIGLAVAAASIFQRRKLNEQTAVGQFWIQHQGSSTIDVIFVSNETRHFFVTRQAPIRREMIKGGSPCLRAGDEGDLVEDHRCGRAAPLISEVGQEIALGNNLNGEACRLRRTPTPGKDAARLDFGFNGNATYSGSIFQSSDQRLKSNVQPLDASSSLSLIGALNPVSYTRLDQTVQGMNLGFIAQQVQSLFPELVSTTSPTALTPDGTLTLNYVGLIAPT